jgi:hypothetical protein
MKESRSSYLINFVELVEKLAGRKFAMKVDNVSEGVSACFDDNNDRESVFSFFVPPFRPSL